ncbi:MAG: hypothetical protein IPM42_00445 [Saprospiraceae bacterium]|nr:hypothetical protein [Saprospiraceae bacterium]
MTKNIILSTVIFILTCLSYTYAQHIDFGLSIGGTTYQGDISPLSNRLSFEGARTLKSVHFGYSFNHYYSLKLRYSTTNINGTDASSVDSWRRQRNLHFRSPIQEIALINEVELLDIIPFFRKYSLKPFVNFGVALFKFNPQAKYRGYWVDLQPLSTEGQGLPGSGTAPYALTQISIPFGFGLRYDLNDYLTLSFEISPRVTFTDYLDDVSSVYPDFELLRYHKGYMAMLMSYQGNHFGEEGSLKDVTGMGRGNQSDNDWYIFNAFTLSYRFDMRAAMMNTRNVSGGRRCPRF